MLFFSITCLSFFLFCKCLPLKPLPLWSYDIGLVSLCFWKDLLGLYLIKLIKNIITESLALSSSIMSLKCKNSASKADNAELAQDLAVLDLPELVLDGILERLPPDGLCSMAGVCSFLREKCMSDHLWEKHMKQKWGRIMGPAAYREWQWHIATRKDTGLLEQGNQRGFLGFLYFLWPFKIYQSNLNNDSKTNNSLPVNSIMAWYIALETGKFWFPAQVYNRENGHVGFMLSCYDAALSYDSRTDTFRARYPPHGRRAIAIESGVTWDRLRAPPMDTSAHDLHISDCLNPEIILRFSGEETKNFLMVFWLSIFFLVYYKCFISSDGWWYGVVGHLESCDGNEIYCRCQESDTVVIEFNQYTPGSRWRCTAVNRKEHREEGNEAEGFYGGIRKIYSSDEISTWKRLWPAEVLE